MHNWLIVAAALLVPFGILALGAWIGVRAERSRTRLQRNKAQLQANETVGVAPQASVGDRAVTAMLTAPVVDLEELLEAEIPCGGNNTPYPRACDHAAELRSFGHNCVRSLGPVAFKCGTCWQIWHKAASEVLASLGVLACPRCKQHFHSVESFSDYRPF